MTVDDEEDKGQKGTRTWISRLTVGAEIIPRHVMHEILQDLLVARLLALTHESSHDDRVSSFSLG